MVIDMAKSGKSPSTGSTIARRCAFSATSVIWTRSRPNSASRLPIPIDAGRVAGRSCPTATSTTCGPTPRPYPKIDRSRYIWRRLASRPASCRLPQGPERAADRRCLLRVSEQLRYGRLRGRSSGADPLRRTRGPVRRIRGHRRHLSSRLTGTDPAHEWKRVRSPVGAGRRRQGQ